MKKFDLDFCLHILNIVLGIYTIAMMIVLWITICMAPNGIAPTCVFILLIILKLLFLTALFNITKKKFPNMLLYEVFKELKVNPYSRKHALLLSFCYDAVIMLCVALPHIESHDFITLLCLPIFWEAFTFGGICMFYISLFCIWKIQDKNT